MFCPTYWGMFIGHQLAHCEWMHPDADETPLGSAAFAALLVESGLISDEQFAYAEAEHVRSGAAVDIVLVSQGVMEPAVLRSMLARAWNLPAIDLAHSHVDHELVNQWPDETYLSENWFPVRDQANGTVLIATSRIPNAQRTERIVAVIESPVEFAVVASVDIVAAVARAVKRRGRGRRLFPTGLA